MQLDYKKPSTLGKLIDLLTTPIDSYRHWGAIIVMALMFVFMPQLPSPNDWERNTAGLVNGLNIYQDPNFVYPPWGLILLWPYYFITASGSRLASVLIMGWLASKQGDTLLRFGAMIASPFFLWTMITSNLDVLALLLPVVLWESSRGKSRQWLGWSVSMLLLLIKPQSGGVMILYLVWRHRDKMRQLTLPISAIALTILPISLIGTPPLILQWLDNTFFNPSSENLGFWKINNISLTSHLGPIKSVIIFMASIIAVYALMQFRGKPWTQNHTFSSVFLFSMLVGPYASNQGLIVPLALVASWPAVAMQFIMSFTLSHFGVFREYSAWWALLFGMSALWMYEPKNKPTDVYVPGQNSSGSNLYMLQ